MSSKKQKVLRGALSKKSELIEFYKFLDANTPKAFLGKPYYDPKSTEYGLKTTKKGYRPTNYGTIEAAMKKFTYKGKPSTRPTINSRMQLNHGNGITESSKPTQQGAKPVSYEKWEQTPTHKSIIDKVSGAWDTKKERLTRKGYKYDRPLYMTWLVTKTDPLEMSMEQWLTIWGKHPKEPNQCHPTFKDAETGLLSVDYATGLRWVMKNSKDPHVKDARQTDDSRFNVKLLKRKKGKHKGHYFREEQCFLLPRAIKRVDTLMLSYYGQLFGGRFEALNKLTPEKIDYEAHKLIVFESKVQAEVEKPIYEPETGFMRRYIMENNIAINQPMFGRSISAYNTELKETRKWFETTDFPLNFDPTTHTAFKHTCVTQMSLHGVRMDTISDYIGTDPNTLKEFYRGGSEENVDEEIGGIKKGDRKAPTWRAFVKQLTDAYEARYDELRKKPKAPMD